MSRQFNGEVIAFSANDAWTLDNDRQKLKLRLKKERKINLDTYLTLYKKKLN